MNRIEFVNMVMGLTGISEPDRAEKLSIMVLQTFKSQLNRHDRKAIDELIPRDVRELWHGSLFQRFISGLLSLRDMDMDDLIEQVREGADLESTVEAEGLIRAVLAVLKAALPPREIHSVARDLPADVNQFWLAA